MKKNEKKGFTLVELLIVIAIIAILATVSIVGYTQFIKKATESNDISLTTQMNNALQAGAIDGKNKTMSEAIADLQSSGVDIETLSPRTDGYIYVWDSVNDKIILLNENKEIVAPKDATLTNTWDAFTVVHSAEHLTKFAEFSWYIAQDFDGTEITTSQVIGVDTGKNANITKITIAGDQTRTVTANSNLPCDLEVNAPNAVVNHYGELNKLDVIAIAGESYHEFGKIIGNVTFAKGHIAVENGAVVPTIVITASSDEEIKITVNTQESTVSVVATVQEVAEKLAEIVQGNGKKEVVEEVIDTTEASLFAGGLGTKESPYLIANAEQFANINTLYPSATFTQAYYFKQIADITVSSQLNYFAGGYDGGGHTWSTLLRGQSSNVATFISEQIEHLYIKNLVVNMGNAPVTLVFYNDWGTTWGMDIENITFNGNGLLECNSTNFGLITSNPLYTNGEGRATYNFKNITNNADIQNAGTCTSFLVGSGPCFNAPADVYYENCVNNGKIFGTTFVGFLYGNGTYIESMNDGSTLTVTNCKNNGLFMSTASSGTVNMAPKYELVDSSFNATQESLAGGVFRASNYFEGADVGFVSLNQNGSSFSINIAENTQVTYELVAVVGSIYTTVDFSNWNESYEDDLRANLYSGKIVASNSVRYRLGELNVNATETGAVNGFHAYDYKTAIKEGIVASGTKLTYTDGICLIVKDGTNLLILEECAYRYANSEVTLVLYAYDNNGSLIGIKNIK